MGINEGRDKLSCDGSQGCGQDLSDKATLCDLAPFIINHIYGTKKTIREVLFSTLLHDVNKEKCKFRSEVINTYLIGQTVFDMLRFFAREVAVFLFLDLNVIYHCVRRTIFVSNGSNKWN